MSRYCNLVVGTLIDQPCPDCEHVYAVHYQNGLCALCEVVHKVEDVVEYVLAQLRQVTQR